MKCRYKSVGHTFFWVEWKLRYGQASPWDLLRVKGASSDLKFRVGGLILVLRPCLIIIYQLALASASHEDCWDLTKSSEELARTFVRTFFRTVNSVWQLEYAYCNSYEAWWWGPEGFLILPLMKKSSKSSWEVLRGFWSLHEDFAQKALLSLPQMIKVLMGTFKIIFSKTELATQVLIRTLQWHYEALVGGFLSPALTPWGKGDYWIHHRLSVRLSVRTPK